MRSRFFFDRNIAIRLAQMIAAYDQESEIVHQDDDPRFVSTDEDTFIIAKLAEDVPRPVFITADVNMYTRRPNERAALATSGLTCIFFKKGYNNLPVHDQAMKILKLWPIIVDETSRCSQPTAFEITPAGTKLHRLCLTREL